MDYQILVNKTNPLSKDYKPNNLVDTGYTFDFEGIESNHKVVLEKETLNAFNKLKIDVFNKFNVYINIENGYRSYNLQSQVLNMFLQTEGEEAYKMVALPGESEHQTGLAIDLLYYTKDRELIDIYDDNQDAIRWVIENCYRYGFILRYPKDKTDITGFNYEPWHIRYVGENLSEKIKKLSLKYHSDITLEEYYIKFKK